MSEHRGTDTCLTIQHSPLQQEKDSTTTVATSTDKRRKRSSSSSNGTTTKKKSMSARRRPGNSRMPTTESDAGSSRTAQRSTPSPDGMASVNFTKTGRVSKAKKGLKVHDCECGRSYTRAEHLRRHRRNHAQEDGMVCKYPDCGKTFVRSDLLQRHEERHNELGRNASRQPSVANSEHSTQPSPMTVPASLPMAPAHTLSAVPYHQMHAISPQLEPPTLSRYNPAQFRTPQLPRTPKVAHAKTNNHFLTSNLTFKTPPKPSSNKHIQNTYSNRHSISGQVLVDGMATSGAWVPESWAPSPYSCSSGYASPVPCHEYGSMYATPPYGAGMVRTRASSDASFMEQNWAQASQSPTSSISFPYSWATDEKSIMAPTFPYAPVSYSTDMPMHVIIGTAAQYGHYDPHDLVQMDHEEEVQLFHGAHYGMSQIARAEPFEQWLNSYWRRFHPTFPVVHRPTFASIGASPLLCAAMCAIGAHHSNDSYNARDLHARCVKLLLKRQHTNMAGCDRICDLQAIFLVEVFSLNFARRCARTLSTRFLAMYNQLSGIRSIDSSAITSTLFNDSESEDNVQDRWLQWARVSTKQRLLVSCFLLESRHLPILSNDQSPPSIQITVEDLPLPSKETLWEAPDARQWWIIVQEDSMTPRYVAEATAVRPAACYDIFQSSVLIAALYHPSSRTNLHLDFAAEQLLSDHPITQQQHATEQLVQLAPIRALLAVSGEAWILGVKVTSQEEFGAYELTLRSWVAQLWSGAVGNSPQSAVKALRISIGILAGSLHSQEPCRSGLGNELGLFYATLILWAATAAASNSLFGSGFSSQQARSSLTTTTTIAPTTSPAHMSSQPAFLSTNGQFTVLQQVAPSFPADRRCSMPHTEIVVNTSHFLSTIIDNLTSFNVAACQIGCRSLLLWTKMQLRGSPPKKQVVTQLDQNSNEYRHGELINEAISQIERMLSHPWEHWSI